MSPRAAYWWRSLGSPIRPRHRPGERKSTQPMPSPRTASVWCTLRARNLPLHRLAQDLVHARLVARPCCSKIFEYVRIDTDGCRDFRGRSLRPAPAPKHRRTEHFLPPWRIVGINRLGRASLLRLQGNSAFHSLRLSVAKSHACRLRGLHASTQQFRRRFDSSQVGMTNRSNNIRGEWRGDKAIVQPRKLIK